MLAKAIQRIAGIGGALVAVIAARRVKLAAVSVNIASLIGSAQIVVLAVFVGKAAHFTRCRDAQVRLQITRVVGARIVIAAIVVGIAALASRHSHMRASARQRVARVDGAHVVIVAIARLVRTLNLAAIIFAVGTRALVDGALVTVVTRRLLLKHTLTRRAVLARKARIDRLRAYHILVDTLASVNVARVDCACIAVGAVLGIVGCTACRVAVNLVAQVCRQRQEVCAFASLDVANVFGALVVIGAVEIQSTAIRLGSKVASIDVEIAVRLCAHASMLAAFDVRVTAVGNATNLRLTFNTNRLVAHVPACHVGKVDRGVFATSDRVASVFGTRITIVADNRNVNRHVVLWTRRHTPILSACILIVEIDRLKDTATRQRVATVESAWIRVVASLIVMLANSSFIVADVAGACIAIAAKHHLFVDTLTRARIATIIRAHVFVVAALGERDTKRRMGTRCFETARLFALVCCNAFDAVIEALTRRNLADISGAIKIVETIFIRLAATKCC